MWRNKMWKGQKDWSEIPQGIILIMFQGKGE